MQPSHRQPSTHQAENSFSAAAFRQAAINIATAATSQTMLTTGRTVPPLREEQSGAHNMPASRARNARKRVVFRTNRIVTETEWVCQADCSTGFSTAEFTLSALSSIFLAEDGIIA